MHREAVSNLGDQNHVNQVVKQLKERDSPLVLAFARCAGRSPPTAEALFGRLHLRCFSDSLVPERSRQRIGFCRMGLDRDAARRYSNVFSSPHATARAMWVAAPSTSTLSRHGTRGPAQGLGSRTAEQQRASVHRASSGPARIPTGSARARRGPCFHSRAARACERGKGGEELLELSAVTARTFSALATENEGLELLFTFLASVLEYGHRNSVLDFLEPGKDKARGTLGKAGRSALSGEQIRETFQYTRDRPRWSDSRGAARSLSC